MKRICTLLGLALLVGCGNNGNNNPCEKKPPCCPKKENTCEKKRCPKKCSDASGEAGVIQEKAVAQEDVLENESTSSK